jgi:hypothetical protein
MRWQEMKQRIDEYEAGPKYYPIIAAICTAFIIPFVALATHSLGAIVTAFFLCIIGSGVLAAMTGIKCPYCGRRIQGLGRNADLLILRNMRQCPHCQGKFPD